MIGFKLHAYGGGGFTYDSSRWTEGSLAALKLPFKVLKKPLRSTGGLLKGVEKGFHNNALKSLYHICSLGWDLKLSVIGDVFFQYNFRSNASFDRTYAELVMHMRKLKLGDQVVLEFSTAISIYHGFVISNNHNGPIHMLITIDL